MDAIEKEKKEVFDLIKKFIGEVIGPDFLEDLDIKEESTFTKDLEMDSIEIVSLAEKVKNHYGDTIDFNSWLTTLDMEQLINLRIVDIVNFIVDANNSDK